MFKLLYWKSVDPPKGVLFRVGPCVGIVFLRIGRITIVRSTDKRYAYFLTTIDVL